jgi:hypothetical protein
MKPQNSSMWVNHPQKLFFNERLCKRASNIKALAIVIILGLKVVLSTPTAALKALSPKVLD